MKNFTVIDNFLPEDIHKNISDMVFGGTIPLFYQHNTLTKTELGKNDQLNKTHNIDKEGHAFFYHMFFNDLRTFSSDYNSAYIPIIEKINPIALMRVKMNVYTNPNYRSLSERISSGWHVDMKLCEHKYTTAVYHINTNNGYTLFEDGTKVKSVANRLVTFPGNTLHTGITQTEEETRALINLNYLK